MALSLGQTGTADSITAEYLTQQSDSPALLIYMHQDAVDGMARDAIEGYKALPRRGAEVGGLLLGHVEPGERPVVWIERFQRLECRHRFGPRFVLDDEDHAALERAAAAIARAGELNVVGFYRSHTGSGFDLEQSDLDLVSRYFTDTSDLILLIRPQHLTDVTARFFARPAGGELRPAGTIFPFRGRVVGPLSMEPVEPDTARTNPQPPEPERPRRLVPDFDPLAQAPRPEEPIEGPKIRKWWLPLWLAVLAVAVVCYLFLPKEDRRNAVETVAPIRPLGLYVDPSGDNWRVSWNPAATALNKSRGVALFVRDGDDQNRIDLAPADLQSGTYQYRPKGQDVTFRLEVTDAQGRISAESFRSLRPATPPPAPVAATAPVPPPVAAPALSKPRPIHRVPPVVAASIRPRIRGTIPVDVRVHVDAKGRVISAAPVARPRSGIETYLADRAIIAAKQWRFAPDAPGAETIHFVFER